jgi:hypothetical protein
VIDLIDLHVVEMIVEEEIRMVGSAKVETLEVLIEEKNNLHT